MPRLSGEARAAAAFRVGGAYPKPPRHLGKRPRQLWNEIVRSKPLDWFDPGSLGLLARYCSLLAYAETVERGMGEVEGIGGAIWTGAGEVVTVSGMVAELRRTSVTLSALATKLRLSVQASVRRDSGKLDEPGRPAGPAKLSLIGGKAVAG